VADPEQQAAVDRALAEWRQGDCVVAPELFLWRAEPARPLTAASEQGCDPDSGATAAEVLGLVVLTQTCDVVRACAERPYVEVAPLVALAAPAGIGSSPRYAPLPALAADGLFADLDRSMTVEKAVVAGWSRREGCRNEDERRAFAARLERKRGRFAFPDAFVEWMRPLQKRLTEKHNKGSPEGAALRALREIRVHALPSWEAPKVEVSFWFVLGPDAAALKPDAWAAFLREWTDRLPESTEYHLDHAALVSLEDLTARDYVESVLLDLGYLSEPRS
jgi:hypothetical protein